MYGFDPNQYNQPHSPTEGEAEQKTNLLRFYRGVGNLSEFGLCFCSGLLLALLARLLGMLMPYILLQLAILSYLWATSQDHRERAVIVTALALGVVGGWWDAWYLWLVGSWPVVVALVLIVMAGVIVLLDRRQQL